MNPTSAATVPFSTVVRPTPHGREALEALPEAGLRAEQLSVERLAALYRVLSLASPTR